MATMPIAIGISEQIGGHPSLTAVFVSLTGAAILPLSETGGAFAGLAMGLNGLFTAVTLPVAAQWMGW